MDLRSARMVIRTWQQHDDSRADAWPPYHDPLESIWNLPRQGSGPWGSGLEFSAARRTWAVDDLAGRLMGRISLREVDQRQSSARLGVTFGAPYVGRGLGSEAMMLFLDYYFSDLGFELMLLDVAGANQRAVRCYERLGFTAVGNDWRCTGSSFDHRLLDEQRYRHIRQFFRQGPRCFDTQFFEMQLYKNEWIAHRAAAHAHQTH